MEQDWTCGARREPKTCSIKMEVEPLEDSQIETAQDSTAPNNVDLHTDRGGTSKKQVDLQEFVIKTEETELLDSDPEIQMFIEEEAIEFSRISAGCSESNGDSSNLDNDDVIKRALPSKAAGYKKVAQQPLTHYKCELCVKRYRKRFFCSWTNPMKFLEHNNTTHYSHNIMYMSQTVSNITVITAMTAALNQSDRASKNQRILIFRCSGCEELFRTRDMLVEHTQKEDACGTALIPDIFLCCRYCDTSFLTANDLQKHNCKSTLYCPCGQYGYADTMQRHWTKCKQLASTDSYCPCRTTGTVAEMIPHLKSCNKLPRVFLTCSYCSADFYDRFLLKLHKAREHEHNKKKIGTNSSAIDKVIPRDRLPGQLCACGLRFDSICTWNKHTEQCRGTCPFCIHVFASVSLLHKHMSTHNLSSVQQCIGCDVIFETESQLREHARANMQLGRKIMCACGAEMDMLCELEAHKCPFKREIKNTEQHKCDKCNDEHCDTQKCPAEDQSIYCPYCTDVFENEYLLAMHEAQNRTSEACASCGVQLESVCYQSLHSEVCSVSKPTLPCNICNKKFSCKEFLLVHLKSSHKSGDSMERPMVYGFNCRFKCEPCLVAYNKEDALKQDDPNESDPQQVNLQGDDVVAEETHVETEKTGLLTCDPEVQKFLDEEVMEYSRISAGCSQDNGDTTNLDHNDVMKQLPPSKTDGFNGVFEDFVVSQPSIQYNCDVCVDVWITLRPFLEHNRKVHLSTNHMYMAQTYLDTTMITAMAVSLNLSGRASKYQGILVFRCSGCKKLFRTRNMLVEHTQKEDACGTALIPDIFLCCRYCDMSFLTSKDLKKHICKKILYCPCGQCGEMFDMQRHWNKCKQLSRASSFCPCGVIGFAADMKRHFKLCDKYKQSVLMKCQMCLATFYDQHLLSIHKSDCTGTNVNFGFCCKYCSDVFESQHSLAAHEARNLTKEACVGCGVQLKSLCLRNLHSRVCSKRMLTHLCKVCKKEFSKSEFLATHTCAYGYRCTQCLIAFKRQDDFTEHNIIYHPNMQAPAETLVKKNPKSLLKELPSASTAPEFNITTSQPEITDDAKISTSIIVPCSVILSANSCTAVTPTINEQNINPTFVQQTKYSFRGDRPPNNNITKKFIVYQNKAKMKKLDRTSTTGQVKVNSISTIQFKKPTAYRQIVQLALNQQTTTPIHDQLSKYPTVDRESVGLTDNQQSTRLSPGEQRNNPTTDQEDIKPIIKQEAKMPTIEQQIEDPIAEQKDIKPIINEQSGSLTADQNNVNPITNQQTSKIRVNIFPSMFSNILKFAAPIVNDTAVAATVNEDAANMSKTSVDDVYKSGKNIVKTEIKEEPVDDCMDIDCLHEELMIKDDPVDSIDDFIANTEELVLPTNTEDLVLPANAGEMVLPVTTSCPNCKEQIEIYSEHRCALKRFECTVCHTKAASLSKYTRHYKKHGMYTRQCPACRKVVRRQTLVSHIQSHLTQNYDCPLYEIKNMYTVAPIVRTYTCSICKEDIERSDLLSHWERHVLRNNTKQKEACTSQRKQCNTSDARDVIFRQRGCRIRKSDAMLSSESLKQIRLKLLERRHKVLDCVVCKKSFLRRSEFKRHLIEHLAMNAINSEGFNGIYKCDICNELIGPDLVEYKRHMREHAGMMLYECQLCDKVFSDSSNFSKHKKVHGIMYMQCDMCKRKFVSRIMLERHMEFHDKSSPVACHECGKVFYFASSLGKHVANHHGLRPRRSAPPSTFGCNVCCKRFTTMRGKWDHQWLEHSIRKVEADCPLCDEGYRNSMQLRYHLRTVHSEASLSLQEMRKMKRLNTLDKISETAISSRGKTKTNIETKVKEEPKTCVGEDDPLGIENTAAVKEEPRTCVGEDSSRERDITAAVKEEPTTCAGEDDPLGRENTAAVKMEPMSCIGEDDSSRERDITAAVKMEA